MRFNLGSKVQFPEISLFHFWFYDTDFHGIVLLFIRV